MKSIDLSQLITTSSVILLVAAWVAIPALIGILLYRSGYRAARRAYRKEADLMAQELALSEQRMKENIEAREREVRQEKQQLAIDKEQLAYDQKEFEIERQRRVDDIVERQYSEKEEILTAQYDDLRTNLRTKYSDEREKMRTNLAAKEEQAAFAEARYLEEYKKWKERNRDDDIADDIELSPEQMAAFGYINQSKKNFFIQGRAGTGKSTLVQYLKKYSKKKLLLASPTGAAAKLIGGMTLHKLFGLPVGGFLLNNKLRKTKSKITDLLKAAELLIIDEISMVRPDVLDAVDYIVRKARRNINPFGGLQVVLIGDIFQLPPVIKENEMSVFEAEYNHEDAFFFDAHAYKEGNFSRLELAHVHRQSDQEFLQHLDSILHQENLDETIKYFNAAQITDPKIVQESMTITPTNRAANSINNARLAAIPSPERCYSAVIFRQFNSANAPAPLNLRLKTGALIIFTNNSQGIINGTRGIVTDLSDTIITVRLLDNGNEIGVECDEWFEYEYEVDSLTGEIEEYEVGSYRQFPLRLGYAMTIHKAQGMTLDSVVIEKKGSSFFASGQLYVALSRTRTKDGIHIVNPLAKSDAIFNKRILDMAASS